MRVLTAIPTYNERQALPGTYRRLREAVPASDVLIVDDNSPDGTGALADEWAKTDPRVRVLHRTEKAGLGAAYIEAFHYALQRGYDVIVEMDADGSHQPEQLPRLLAAIEHGADLALGSRWVSGGEVRNWPLSRKIISRGGSWYSRVLLGLPIKDITGGYRAFRRSALEAINIDDVESVGYGFQVDMLWRASTQGLRIVEVPITFVERELGTSKMSKAIFIEAILNVTRWGLAQRWRALRRLNRR